MSKALDAAVRYLSRREHGAYELAQKLLQKGWSALDVQHAIDECQRLGLQSDVRFAQTICRARVRQGYGPRKIMYELQKVHIESHIIDAVLCQEAPHWLSHANQVIAKKYQAIQKSSYALMQKQKQFLLYRGFSMDTICQVFKENIENESQ